LELLVCMQCYPGKIEILVRGKRGLLLIEDKKNGADIH